MRHPRLSWILIALLAMVYAQGVAAAHNHGTEKAKTSASCQICLHGQHAKASLPGSAVHAILERFPETFHLSPLVRIVCFRHAIHPPRGPPA